MDKPHHTPSGAKIAQCADEEGCAVTHCAVCLKEIPSDSVKVSDAQDYIQHFCGLECLDRWRRQAGAPNADKPPGGSANRVK